MALDKFELRRICSFERWQEDISLFVNQFSENQDVIDNSFCEAIHQDLAEEYALLENKDYSYASTGHTSRDKDYFEDRVLDEKLYGKFKDAGHVFLGRTISPVRYFYYALLHGYQPDTNQRRNRSGPYKDDYLQDDLKNIELNHPEINKTLRTNQCREGRIIYRGVYLLPKDEFSDMIEYFIDRGRQFRASGWGFPWLDEVIIKD